MMAKTFSKLMTNSKTQIWEAQRIPSKIQIKKSTPIHSILKLEQTKAKKKILKECRERKYLIYKRKE